MKHPKILCLSGSTRGGSFNTRLAALVKKKLALANVSVTQISLADYALPLFDADEEATSSLPQNAQALYDLFATHHGIFIACPEYNASITPLFKNTLDWVSRVKHADHPTYHAFRNRVFALGSASPGGFGGYRGLLAVRHVIEIGLGGHVLAEQVSVPRSDATFTDSGDISDEMIADTLDNVLRRLVEMAEHYARKE